MSSAGADGGDSGFSGQLYFERPPESTRAEAEQAGVNSCTESMESGAMTGSN